MGSTVFRFGRDMRDVKLQSILSCSKGRSWHLGGFSGHSFSKELRLISSFHHLGNDMAIKAYTVLAKMKSCFEDLRSKTFQWEKKGLLSKKKGPKKDPL